MGREISRVGNGISMDLRIGSSPGLKEVSHAGGGGGGGGEHGPPKDHSASQEAGSAWLQVKSASSNIDRSMYAAVS